MIACPVTTAFACWQTEIPKALIPTNSLNVRVTNNGKAQESAKFELHKAITFDLEAARQTTAFERKSVKSAITDSKGLLSFGEIKQGRYWMVPDGATVFGSVRVEVLSPGAGAAKRIWLNYSTDGCLEVSVENAI
jgi:hypothetical protein